MFLARNWWMFLIRGVLALIFGIVALFFPAAAFLSLVIIFGAFLRSQTGCLHLFRHSHQRRKAKIGGG